VLGEVEYNSQSMSRGVHVYNTFLWWWVRGLVERAFVRNTTGFSYKVHGEAKSSDKVGGQHLAASSRSGGRKTNDDRSWRFIAGDGHLISEQISSIFERAISVQY